MQPILEFGGGETIGRVAAVDTSRVFIEVDNHSLVTRMSVGNLVAVLGGVATEYLVGVVDRITRSTATELALEGNPEDGVMPLEVSERDVVRIVLVGTFRAVDGDRRNVFKRGADSFPQIDRECYLLEAANLQRMMNLFAAEMEEGRRLQLGTFVSDKAAIAIADGDRLFQRHAALLGSTGSGKSWSVALILQRASKLQHPNLIVLDMHGEYHPLASEHGFAASFRIAGPGDIVKPSDNALFLPYWLLNHEEMLALVLDRSDQNAPNQASRFAAHVRDLKAERLRELGNEDVLQTFTVDSPIPYSLDDLVARLDADDTEMVPGSRAGVDKQGPLHGKLTRFVARLRAKISDRRYGFLFAPPPATLEYGWLPEMVGSLLRADKGGRGIKIIDFSEVPSDILPIVTGVLARVLYDVQFWMDEEDRTPFALVCDEAHQYLPVKEGTDAVQARAVEVFERIAKEGRKYGVSLLVVSQRPSDVNRTILSQCNNFLVLRLTNDQDQAVVRRLMPDSMGGLTDMLPLLDIGEAMLLGDAVLLPSRIRLDPPTIKPDSATRAFWSEWDRRGPDASHIATAVECMRRQMRSLEELAV